MINKVLVLIPAYNESLSLPGVLKDIEENGQIEQGKLDILIINDGSKDNTLQVLEELKAPYISHIQNLGLAGAVKTGFRYAYDHGYDALIQFDGDGQHCAASLNDLVLKASEGINIVIGSRYVTKPKPWNARMIGSRLISAAVLLSTGKRIQDPTSGLRLYDRKGIEDYALLGNMPPEPDTLVYELKKGRSIAEVQCEMREREFGESYLNLSKTVKYMSRMIVSILFIQPLRKRDRKHLKHQGALEESAAMDTLYAND